MDDADAFAALSDDDKARLFAGEALEGETSGAKNDESSDSTDKAGEDSSATPAAAATDATEKQPEAAPAQTDEPQVILAKDGSHTIPFSVLETERQRVRDLEQQLQAAQQPAPVKKTEQDTGETQVDDPNAELKALFAERDEALYSGETEKAAELNMRISDIQQERATQAALARFEAREAERQAQAEQETMLRTVEATAADVAKKYPLLDYTAATANKDAIDLVVAERDRLIATGMPFAEALTQAADKVAPLFGATQPTTKQPETKADAEKKAAEVIAKAKSPVPTSLSSVPAGASVHHDEGEAIRSRSGLSLLNTFEGKSADDILKLMSRVI